MRSVVFTLAPCLLLLAACGKSAAVAVAPRIEKISVRVADPNAAGSNLVEVDWVKMHGKGPAVAAANKTLDEWRRKEEVPLTYAEAVAYARPMNAAQLRLLEAAVAMKVEAKQKMGLAVEAGEGYVARNRYLHVAVSIPRDDGHVLSVVFDPGYAENFKAILFDSTTGSALDLGAVAGQSVRVKKKVDEVVMAKFAACPKESTNGLGWPEKTVVFQDGDGHVPLENAKWALTESGLRVVFARGGVWRGGQEAENFCDIDFTIPYSELEGVLPAEWMPPKRK